MKCPRSLLRTPRPLPACPAARSSAAHRTVVEWFITRSTSGVHPNRPAQKHQETGIYARITGSEDATCRRQPARRMPSR